MTAGLLAGIRVLDLTNVLAGPFASYQLALMGADVIKIESPGTGDLARQLGADAQLSAKSLGASFLAQNSQKRSITIDLKSKRGKAVFEELIRGADVLLENFRPGVLERLGFGWDRLRELNSKLIYCAVSGFGSTGPMRNRPAYDQVVQGLSGIMSVTGGPESAPLRVGYPVCDSFGGLAAAFAIAAALVRRHRTGQGAFLDTSMLDAALTSMGWVVSDYLIAGREPKPMANENSTSAPSGTFNTGDGGLNIAANKQEQYDALCRALHRDELIDDPRFRTREDRIRNRDELRSTLETSLKEHSAAYWDSILTHTGVPAAPVRSVPEALSSDQVTHRGLVATLESPAAAADILRVLGSPTHVDGQPISPTVAPPTLGQHTDEILLELGYDDATITALRTEKAI